MHDLIMSSEAYLDPGPVRHRHVRRLQPFRLAVYPLAAWNFLTSDPCGPRILVKASERDDVMHPRFEAGTSIRSAIFILLTTTISSSVLK